jgi:hypothetical protein
VLADFFVKVVGRFFSSQSEKVTTGIERNKNHPLSCSLQRLALNSIRLHGEFLASQKRFCSLKGQDPLKKISNRRKYRGSKGLSIDTTRTPIPGHFTVPVRSLSVSFFIEKEPHKQLRMKRKRRGER